MATSSQLLSAWGKPVPETADAPKPVDVVDQAQDLDVVDDTDLVPSLTDQPDQDGLRRPRGPRHWSWRAWLALGLAVALLAGGYLYLNRTPADGEEIPVLTGQPKIPDSDAHYGAPAATSTAKLEPPPTPAPEANKPQATAPAASQGLTCVDKPVKPNSITIPAWCIHTNIVPMSMDSGQLQIPKDPRVAGVWDQGASLNASARGRTIVAAHVNDYDGGPGAFARLYQLVPGTTVVTQDGAGQNTTWTVVSTEKVLQTDADKILAANPAQRQLVMVTCEGPWIKDKYGTHPKYNRVVTAILATG